ncbi:MAG: type II toxin-antitoxin system HicA family toxin [Spirochaetaceae bacterium]|nr:type II toxin-antitoxin system HicA family toxin [Spirochaetaceae bacterium]
MQKLKDGGWRLDRIKGSHHVFVKPGCPHQTQAVLSANY